MSESDQRQQFQDFADGAAPQRALFLAFLDASWAVINSPDDGDADENLIIFSDFLFVRPTARSTKRAVVAHLANFKHGVTAEIVNAIMPTINADVGGDVVSFGNLRALGSAFTLIGGLVIGQFVDRFGTKLALLGTHISSALSFAVLGTASSQSTVYLSALPLLFSQSFQLTSTAVSLNSEMASRARALGRVGFFYGIGFSGGGLALVLLLRALSDRHVVLLSSFWSVLIAALIACAYPKEEDDEELTGRSGEGLIGVLRRPGVLPILIFKMLVVATAGSITFLTAQFALDPFKFSTSGTALLMSYVSSLMIISQACVTDSVSSFQIYWATAAGVGGSLLGLGVSPATWHSYVFWLTPLSFAFHLANTTLGSLLTLHVPQEELGTAVALSLATMPAGQIFAAQVAARVSKARGFRAVPLVACLCLVGGTAALRTAGYVPPEPGEQDAGASASGGQDATSSGAGPPTGTSGASGATLSLDEE